MSIALYTIFKYYIFSIHTRDTAIHQSVPIEYLQNVDLCRISDLQFSCPKAADCVALLHSALSLDNMQYIYTYALTVRQFFIYIRILLTHTYSHKHTDIHKRAYK